MAEKRRSAKADKGFTKEERAAMRERAQELKAAAAKADGEDAVLAKIAEMPAPDRAKGERIHAIVTASAPGLSPSLPAIVNDIAPDELRGRYNAVFTLSWQIGPVIGPAIAGAALGDAYLVALAAACGACALLARLLARIVPTEANVPAPARTVIAPRPVARSRPQDA